ncbi:pyruvate dehydrogenase E2 component (dihydrolipoamide acetyltransferase) [Arthrobacter sp. V4I6]|uniref:dihydrolipoamide acetyltransferase family protein n=1 Tax=unclassified Arthrobacter TaxID=235627 RepID=UPI00278A1C92|nr:MULTISPECIES: dihydrolipoamide acetyltransferase family protein [unclassified Arthrobacter]MDQ0821607.1 pyruvate dehydrogenase E2 component (dihydrolipoamide acetyltransferase) [Arthrobacter sp. V1I7]MDQ0855872.1 pyruvate dehydrogenase E2 component (dihydrolipoamide acetyltransferase) [Arthrobacter sp. V4I6]
MAEILRMPEVLAGASEASIQTWLVSQGSVLVVDQPIAEIETEKATVELTAEFAGAVGRILVLEGDNVAVGDPIAVLLGEGEAEDTIEAALAGAGLSAAVTPESAPRISEPTGQPASGAEGLSPNGRVAHALPGAGDSGRRFMSPLVRRLARQHGVDVTSVTGTGPGGRIVRRDLDRHLAEPDEKTQPSAAVEPPDSRPKAPPTAPGPVSAEFEDVPLDRMRRAIARRLTESKSTVPHFYLTAHCRADALLALRRQVNETGTRKVSINDFVIKAVAGALVDVPEANAIWTGEAIRRYSSVDISVAVATDGGLTTPVLRSVERMPLSEVSAAVADLAERGRSGRLRQHELEGGSFSVSNLGMYGTTEFTAILNPPQSGILAVGAARPAAVVGPDGELAVGTIMSVTLSADHRVLDGAVGAQWLAAFQRRIENPLSILI